MMVNILDFDLEAEGVIYLFFFTTIIHVSFQM